MKCSNVTGVVSHRSGNSSYALPVAAFSFLYHMIDKPLAFEVIEDHQRPASQARGLSNEILPANLSTFTHFLLFCRSGGGPWSCILFSFLFNSPATSRSQRWFHFDFGPADLAASRGPEYDLEWFQFAIAALRSQRWRLVFLLVLQSRWRSMVLSTTLNC